MHFLFTDKINTFYFYPNKLKIIYHSYNIDNITVIGKINFFFKFYISISNDSQTLCAYTIQIFDIIRIKLVK